MENKLSKNEMKQIEMKLYDICKDGTVDELKTLLETIDMERIDILFQSIGKKKLSALHLAATFNNGFILHYLLTQYAILFPDVRKEYARTPLHEGALYGHAHVVTILLQHGALVSSHTTRGRTPLMYAARGGHVDVIVILLEAGANVNEQSETGITALYEAAKHGRVKAIQVLLEHHADINLGSNTNHTPLHIAISEGYLDVAEQLIKAGANTAVRDSMGVTVWHEAAGIGTEAMELLRRYNVSLDDDQVDVVLARHPFHYAAVEGHAEFCAALIESNMADKNMQDIDGCTSVYYAAANGHANVLEVLLKAGADPNISSIRRSPLHCAVMWKRTECIKLLLAHGANRTALDKDGKSALDICHEDDNIASLLKES